MHQLLADGCGIGRHLLGICDNSTSVKGADMVLLARSKRTHLT